MGDELFRQGGSDAKELAIVQDGGAVRQRRKQAGLSTPVDSYIDRVAKIKKDVVQITRTKIPTNSKEPLNAEALNEEIAQIEIDSLAGWELPNWRPSTLSDQLLKRLKNSVHQLKVVSIATDGVKTQIDKFEADQALRDDPSA